MNYPPQQPLYENHFMGTWVKVYPDRVEFQKAMKNPQSILISQITGTRLAVGEIIIETIGDGSYRISTPKNKDVQQAILQTPASSPQQYYQPMHEQPPLVQQPPAQPKYKPQRKRRIRLHRWYVKQNPKTGKTSVHLHGVEQILFAKQRITENYQLPYIPNEPTGKSVRRAIETSQNHWLVNFMTRVMSGI